MSRYSLGLLNYVIWFDWYQGDGYIGGETTNQPPSTDCFVQGSCDFTNGRYKG